MTELERELNTITKDIAVILSVQKGCQEYQAKTTENVDKLVKAITTLSHDTIYLKSLVVRLDKLEDANTWTNRKVFTIVVTAISAAAWIAFEKLFIH